MSGRESGPPPIATVIGGAQKSGTTSLLRYLAQHPELSGQGPVETSYFFDRDEWSAGWPQAYRRYFYGASTDRLVAKTAMLYARRPCIERLAEHNPACTILLVLRDPVQRAFSSYRMEQNGDWIDKPFAHLLDVLDERDHPWHRLFIQFGEYAAALREIHEHFAPEQVKVLLYEEFTADPAAACADVFAFLGVDPSFTPATDVAHNTAREVASAPAAAVVRWLRRPGNPIKRAARKALPPATFDTLGQRTIDAVHRRAPADGIDPDVRDALAEYFRPLNLELTRMLGRDLSGWTGMARPTTPVS